MRSSSVDKVLYGRMARKFFSRVKEQIGYKPPRKVAVSDLKIEKKERIMDERLFDRNYVAIGYTLSSPTLNLEAFSHGCQASYIYAVKKALYTEISIDYSFSEHDLPMGRTDLRRFSIGIGAGWLKDIARWAKISLGGTIAYQQLYLVKEDEGVYDRDNMAWRGGLRLRVFIDLAKKFMLSVDAAYMCDLVTVDRGERLYFGPLLGLYLVRSF
jgi:hypothetical protein